MSLREHLQSLAEEFAAHPESSPLPRSTVWAREIDDLCSVEVEVAEIDRLAARVAQIRLESAALAGVEYRRLRQLADGLAARLNYLPEPLAVLEGDAEARAAQLRSTAPRCDENGAAYFELMVTPKGLSLRRYHQARGADRAVVPFDFTLDTLQRLADDLREAVRGLKTKRAAPSRV